MIKTTIYSLTADPFDLLLLLRAKDNFCPIQPSRGTRILTSDRESCTRSYLYVGTTDICMKIAYPSAELFQSISLVQKSEITTLRGTIQLSRKSIMMIGF